MIQLNRQYWNVPLLTNASQKNPSPKIDFFLIGGFSIPARARRLISLVIAPICLRKSCGDRRKPWLDLVVSTQRWGMLHLVCEKLQEINSHVRHSMFRNRMQRKWIGWCWQVSDMKSWGSQKRTQVKEIIESYWPFNDFALRSLLLSKCNLWAIHRGCQLCRGIRHTLNTHESICNVWVSFKEVHVTPLPEK